MAIFGRSSKNSSSMATSSSSSSNNPIGNALHSVQSSPLFSSLTPSSSNKSLQNISIHNPLSSSQSHSQVNIQNNNTSTSSGSTSNSCKLSINIESPPIVLYGNPEDSSGSILSGLLRLEILPKRSNNNSNNNNNINHTNPHNGGNHTPITNTLTPVRSAPSTADGVVKIQSVSLSLVQTMTYSKPFLPPSSTLQSCANCKIEKTELARWDVLTEAADFIRGTKHGYPFSHLIPGSLPQTTHLSNIGCVIAYDLIAKVVVVNNKGKKNSNDDVMMLKLPVIVKRSILRGPDRNSLRVFPPTEVTAFAVLPNVLYPKSSFPIELKLENVTSNDRRWRMRKLNWRLEENIKIRAHSCDQHKFKLKVVEEHTRKLQQQQQAAGAASSKKSKTTASGTGSTPATGNNGTPSSSSTTVPPQQQQTPAPPAQDTNIGISAVASQTPNPPSAAGPNSSLRNELDDLLENDAPRRPILNDATHNAGDHEPVVETEDAAVQEPPQQDQDRSLYLEESRTISNGELKSGWKSDFSNKGRIELVADISLVNLATIGLSSSLNNLNSIDSNNASSSHYDNRNLLNNVGSNCSCDLRDDTLGVYVSHMLIVEMVVGEEVLQHTSATTNAANAQAHANAQAQAALKPMKSRESPTTRATAFGAHTSASASSPPAGGIPLSSSMSQSSNAASRTSPTTTANSDNRIGVPTGAARILRMQFKVVLTERSGLGIAWDDEVPPTYHDIKAFSPPSYEQTINVAQLADITETPALSALTFPEPALTHVHRSPNVLYGAGETPGVTFTQAGSNTVDEELENFQELQL